MKKSFKNTVLRLVGVAIIIIFAGFHSFGQSLVIDLQYNPMSFTNANRTVLINTGSVNNIAGAKVGSKHKYTNVATIDGHTIYAHLTILEIDDIEIRNFDDDAITGEKHRFQPRLGNTSGSRYTSGNDGHILYQLEFFDTDTDWPVFLKNYWLTGVDIDGDGQSVREYNEIGGYSSYVIDAQNQLTIYPSPLPNTDRTRFEGISYSLSGVTFENKASYLARFENANNKITFALGITKRYTERYFSVQFGQAGGTFPNPNPTNNPLPVAVDDFGNPIDKSVGGTAINNILDNDLYDGSAVVPSEVNITEISAASHSGVQLNTTTGEVTIASGTPVGTYTMIYQICLVANPTKCDLATITVYVIEKIADLQIVKTANPNPVLAGQNLTYTLTVTNNGPDAAENVKVADALPSGITFVSASPSQAWSAPNWTIGSLANGASVQMTIVATVNNSTTGTISNTAVVSSDTPDPNPNNNTSTKNVEVGDTPNLENNFAGTLAYEDLWPGKGDYDFNDLVLDYHFKTTSDVNNYVVKVEAAFTIKAFGAGLENGFGFQLASAINQEDLNVSGYSLTEDYITLNSNGTENGQSISTIIVYDNAYNEMEHPGVGIGVNTDPNAPYVEPKTINILIIFPSNTYTLSDLDIANFNPFLIANLTRGHEVHLPNYLPTDLMDTDLFATFDDDSNPGSGKYFKTISNLPWAINIIDGFDYPIEKRQINTAFLHFIEWAESGGTVYNDWYMDKAGYRNSSNIYREITP